MSRTFLIGAAFLCNVLIGNMCMIGLKSDARIATRGQSGVQMSQNDVTKCPWITRSPALESEQEESPCATGHCFSQPDPYTQDKLIALQEITSSTAAAVPSIEFTYPPIVYNHTRQPTTHSPPIIDMRMIVMLL